MTSLEPEGFSVLEVETRFLYPFLYDTTKVGEAATLLTGLNASRGDKGDKQVWNGAQPHEFYRQELLDNVLSFLFCQDPEEGCQFFRVDKDLVHRWFKNGLPMSTAQGTLLHRQVACAYIELFLSPNGAGVLSIALKPLLGEKKQDVFDISNVKDFNYHGAQLRNNILPRFTLPYPEVKPDDQMADPPAGEAPLRERLGFPGGTFNLRELCEFLLQPISPVPVQSQLSIYSVVRLSDSVSFDSEATCRKLAPVLAGFAQIEERLHPGAPEGEITVPNRILNSKHWAAVSFLGAAHLVAHQCVPFDGQRMQTVFDKYFVPYLAAFLQRLATYRILASAQGAVKKRGKSPSPDMAPSLAELRFEVLRFAVCSNFTEVSSREVLNRFYDLSREGLRVSTSLAIAKEAILDLDAADTEERGQEMNKLLGKNVSTVAAMSEQLSENVRIVSTMSAKLETNIETVADVQTKIEWLEVFFVSFYAAELSELIGKLWGFPHTYAGLAVPLWMSAGLIMAAWGLRPWHRKPISKRALAMVIVFVILWIVGGLLWPKPKDASVASSGVQEPSSPEHTGAEGRVP